MVWKSIWEMHSIHFRRALAYPHGMCTTNADVINQDLLAFVKRYIAARSIGRKVGIQFLRRAEDAIADVPMFLHQTVNSCTKSRKARTLAETKFDA